MRWMGEGLSVMATFLIGGAAFAQDNMTSQTRALAVQTQAMAVILGAADSICFSVNQVGKQSSNTLSGETTAKLNGVIAKVADLNVKGSAQLTSMDYQGVLQGELAQTLNSSQNCKKSIFEILVAKMLPTVTSETGLPGTQGINLIPRTVEQPSPGVDCRNTNEPIENLLCADADLAKADGRMGRLYQQKMQRLDAAGKASLRQQQRNWIQLRDATCNVPTSGNLGAAELAPTKPCILKITQQRANQLASP